MKYFLLTLIALTLAVLHQDYWNWGNKTLVFGYVPIGLFYHACFSVACAVMMALFVKFAWPHDLEASEKHES
jgi:hypothetical protein